MKWHALTPVGDEFFTTAPVVSTNVIDVPVPIDELWAALEADDAVVGWGAGATGMRWTTARPFGIGTVREVSIAGVAKVREEFYRWDAGKRMTFFVAESNRPGIRSFAEDYLVESTATGSRLTWIVAMQPKLGVGPLAPVLSRIQKAAIGSMAKGLQKKLS